MSEFNKYKKLIQELALQGVEQEQLNHLNELIDSAAAKEEHNKHLVGELEKFKLMAELE
jgi:hypothetical protein